MSDSIQNALSQLQAAGLLVNELRIDTPRPVRVDVEGHRKGKKAGWYWCHWHRLDNGDEVVVGAFGVWQGTDNNAQKIKLKGQKLDSADRERIRERQAALRKKHEEQEAELAREVGQRASDIWQKLPVAEHSAYLQRKKVPAYGLKRGRDGTVVMPLRNAAGVLCQLQFIDEAGQKRFLTGPGKKGAFHLIGEPADDAPLVFCEGYATGASIHRATRWPVVVCVDAGNLLPVSKALRPRYPSVRFLFAGDDDHEKLNPRTGDPDNAGRTKALAASRHFKCPAVFPRFDDPRGRTDFNDLDVEQGAEAVRDQLHQRNVPATPALPQAGDSAEPWAQDLVWQDRGGLKPMVHNAMVVLEHHPAWKGVFAFDEFEKRVVLRKPGPYSGSLPGILKDRDEIEIAAWFGRPDRFGIAMSSQAIHEAVYGVASRYPFHPVRDYLEGLEWDGTERLPTFFSDFCNAQQSEVTAAFSLNFFISSVARIFRPGCKADLMLVLEGEQGARKSSLAQTLCGSDWYVDVGTSPTDKDFYQLIQGKWIVEISEMASFAKAEVSHIKRAVSVAIDHFRVPYGRNVESFPRECVFFGTSNDSDWQRDATGGRRYMPVWVSDVELDAVESVRDQLWAEAVVRFNRSETWHELPESAIEEQDLRYLEDIWAEAIYKWLEGKLDSDRYGAGVPCQIMTATTSEILCRALELDRKKQDRQAQMRVGNIMRRLGWTRCQRRQGKTRIYEYRRPADEGDS